MFSPRINSLITFLIIYVLIGMVLMCIAGAGYYSRDNEARGPIDEDPTRAASVRRRANRWAVAGLLHLGFSYWAYDQATKACPLEPKPDERQAADRTTRLALATGVAGFVAAAGAALVVDIAPLLAQ